MRWTSTRLLRATLCCLVTLSLAVSASAQFKASIQGTVTDPSGAVISGATVMVTNQETGKAQQVTTSDDGFYRVRGRIMVREYDGRGWNRRVDYDRERFTCLARNGRIYDFRV